jgi:hypothetical protein
MRNRLRVLITVLALALIFSSVALSVSRQTQQARAVKEKSAAASQKAAPAAAPRHDLSGTWEPANGPSDGIQADGVKAMPNDGKPEHQLPYTPYGLRTYKSHQALFGPDENLPEFNNDPRDKCEPLGFPRMNFYNLRETQILQSEYKVVILYEYGTAWRVIWTDGRELPKLVDGGVMIGKEVRSRDIMAIRWANGWTTPRWSSRQSERWEKIGFGWIPRDVPSATRCMWKSDCTASTAITWSGR